MRRMFSENQIKEMIKANSTRLYLHSGEVDGDTYNIVCPVVEPFNKDNIKSYFIGVSPSNSTACYLLYEEGTFTLNDLTGAEISSGESIVDEVTPL